MKVGVTIAVPAPARERLAAIRIEAGDPLGAVVDPHVTLLPETVIDAADLSDFEQHLDKVAAMTTAFKLRLSGSGSFRPVTDVVFAAVTAGADDCAALAAALRAGPIDIPDVYPYHAHVTVAQNVTADALDRAERDLARFRAAFTVSEILLSTHSALDVPAGSTGRWTPLRRFPLNHPDEPTHANGRTMIPKSNLPALIDISAWPEGDAE